MSFIQRHSIIELVLKVPLKARNLPTSLAYCADASVILLMAPYYYKCKKLNSLHMVLEAKSQTAKIILKHSVCIFLNILLKTVILNYLTIWLLTPTLSKKNYTITCLYYVYYIYICFFIFLRLNL